MVGQVGEHRRGSPAGGGASPRFAESLLRRYFVRSVSHQTACARAAPAHSASTIAMNREFFMTTLRTPFPPPKRTGVRWLGRSAVATASASRKRSFLD